MSLLKLFRLRQTIKFLTAAASTHQSQAPTRASAVMSGDPAMVNPVWSGAIISVLLFGIMMITIIKAENEEDRGKDRGKKREILQALIVNL